MQQTNNSRAIADKSRQGIALIMVLGVLTLLTLMAVSFAITMRTERLAAENYVYVVKARHLLNEALAQALFETDDYLGGADPMMYPDFSKSGPPLTNVFVSVGGSEGPKDFLYGEVESFVPLSVWDETVSAANTHVKWNNIEDPSTGDVIGRFAYMVLNCSGLLDANYAGGLTHTNGMDPREISLNGIAGVTENTFLDARENTWLRYESLPELTFSDDGINDATMDGLFIYSWFPEGMHFRSGLAPTTSLVMINNTNMPDYKSKVLAAFEASGIPNPEGVYENLVDYMDEDDFPQDPDSFCTEAIPMINEVVFSNRFKRLTVSNYTWDATLSIETWQPFPDNSPDCVIQPAVEFQVYPATAGQPGGTIGAQSYQQNGFSFRIHTFNLSQVPGVAADMPQVIRASIGVTNYSGGVIVDRLPSPFRFEYDFRKVPPDGSSTYSVTNLPINGEVSYVQSKSVPDPRMNGYASYWLTEEISLGSINSNAFEWGEGPGAMFVRNKPLQSIGELGFLSVSGVWETISLYPHEIKRQDGTKNESFHRVLDYFTLGTNRPFDVMTKDTNIICKGSVNINTRHQKVLEAVLIDTPVEHYPAKAGMPAVGDIVGTKASAYAQAIIDRSSKTNFRRISEIGDVDELCLNLANDYNANIQLRALYANAPPNFIPDSVNESIIRNAHQLFGVRQNLFTIILAAQVTDGGGSNPAVFAEQRAVAVVWRDPVADDSGKHPCFVRFFKLLAD
ncbi:MAG: hypothetical protein AB7T27_02245 [Kiritimatiellia bacterium]